MTLKNDRELENTKRKLESLQRLMRDAEADRRAGRETEVRSLTRLANQLREEIARYEAASAAARIV